MGGVSGGRIHGVVVPYPDSSCAQARRVAMIGETAQLLLSVVASGHKLIMSPFGDVGCLAGDKWCRRPAYSPVLSVTHGT